MSVVVKRYIPIVILAGLALFSAGDTLLLEPTYNSLATSGRSASAVVSAFAVGLSVILLSRNHARRIMRKRTVIESSVLLICLWAMLIMGFFRFVVYGVRPSGDYMVQRLYVFSS